MKGNNIAILITAFAAIIIGLGLLGSVATEVEAKTSLSAIQNETISITPNCTGACGIASAYAAPQTITLSKASYALTDCPISSFVIYDNGTGPASTRYVDYNLSAGIGVITLYNFTEEIKVDTRTNTTNASYAYCGEGYVSSGFGQTTLKLVVGFFALGLMAVGVALMFYVFKNEGIMNI